MRTLFRRWNPSFFSGTRSPKSLGQRHRVYQILRLEARSCRLLDVGHIDNDGDPDLLGGGHLSGALGWWENLTGSILDARHPQWGPMSRDAAAGPASTLTVEVRASDDPLDLGRWIEVPASGSELAPLIGPDPRYFRYRLTLESFDPAESPMVREVRVVSGPTALVRADGFESGDAGAWSATLP